ncbi:GPI mannosyltransferase 2 [Diorhabda sublineata]|uniref:GPI mannosyltransferase 2 n=1 Tax=Diorhabda sublineata TaxID=1163346 RepID=UPI0024E07BCE|nr:GPI mannosyltransferase 2 [Diorhabda sublineata]
MNENKLTRLAIFSRLFIIFLQFLSNLIIPDHDARVFQYLRSPQHNETYVFLSVNYILKGFIRWDAEYFMHIAKYGYTYENTLAFFPLYPYLSRTIVNICELLFYGATIDTSLIITFTLLNIMFLCLSVKLLYKLTKVYFNEDIAYKTTILFIFNPASIFFSAPYSESFFCYLTLETIYRCTILLQKYSKSNSNFHYNDTSALFFISLSTIVRSNGLLNIGFLIYTITCIFLTYFPKNSVNRFMYILKFICIFSISILVCVLPFALYQIYCFQKFCRDFELDLPEEIILYASENNLVLPGQFKIFNQTWCYSKIPLAYSYVQDHYWNVGFLQYYQLKQIPNFLLAFPSLYIVIHNSIRHIKINISNFSNLFNLKEVDVNNRTNCANRFFNFSLNVFVIHALFLSVFCLLFIHVQVFTRMICSASPLFYWYCAFYWINGRKRFIKLFFDCYFFIGTVMFCNFLPWT